MRRWDILVCSLMSYRFRTIRPNDLTEGGWERERRAGSKCASRNEFLENRDLRSAKVS